MKIELRLTIALAEHLFELELDSICQNPEFHFEFNDWLDKFGPKSIELLDQITSAPENEFNSVAIKELALKIQHNFEAGHWSINHYEDSLYNYEMPSYYSAYITMTFEKQLAVLTGVGIQQEINFA